MGRARKLKQGALARVEVEALGPDLVGRGKTNAGQAVEVVGALPGELVSARVEHVTATGRAFARLVSVERSSPARRDSPCPHYQGNPSGPLVACGGCDLLHVDRSFELALKKARVETALECVAEPTLGGHPELGYRALAKLVVDGGKLGSYAPWTHSVAEMDGCPIHSEVVESAAAHVRASLRDMKLPALRFVLIRGSLSTGRVVVTLVTKSLGDKDVRVLSDELSRAPEVAKVILLENDRSDDVIVADGPMEVLVDRGPVREQIGPISIELAGPAFAQVNPSAAAELYSHVASALEGKSRVADVYAGSGGIGLTLAARGAKVFSVESNRAAAGAIARSAEAMGLGDRLSVVAARAEEALGSLPEVDAIVINPPRKGASPDVLGAVMRRAPTRLVYVSCNPDTLARDVSRMRSASEFAVRSVTPVDLFPKTRHIETVLVADIHARSSS